MNAGSAPGTRVAAKPIEGHEAVSSAAWILLALLTALNVLNFVVRQLIPSLAPLLIADLGLTRVISGNLVKVCAWYDNEMGYTSTLVQHVIVAGRSV